MTDCLPCDDAHCDVEHRLIELNKEHCTYHELAHKYMCLRHKITLIEETIIELRYRWARVVMAPGSSSEETESASQRMLGVKEALDVIRQIKGDSCGSS